VKFYLGEFVLETHKSGNVSMTYDGLTVTVKEYEIEEKLHDVFVQAEDNFMRALHREEADDRARDAERATWAWEQSL
jgi:hypothetical protein